MASISLSNSTAYASCSQSQSYCLDANTTLLNSCGSFETYDSNIDSSHVYLDSVDFLSCVCSLDDTDFWGLLYKCSFCASSAASTDLAAFKRPYCDAVYEYNNLSTIRNLSSAARSHASPRSLLASCFLLLLLFLLSS
ncbi:uncharacterized protein ASCRUDRAFT_73022 [Ascoidea rubescens DSM 1968]|uniref:Uncharacterized protein n=1 Tax=Ascoidea rubescens DSM 1968 TaxID=1344418 RepID=A0A1D2V8K5_9ASCO|nr:hypothetical protein ASCRUDRAFT_73022 [Ascoidea rubescens DSM 1968]ODV57960.1 hypothetical protein ASCRUDRAFT_73022 [Ascoidea rubescens DSM 1968]